MCLSEFPPHATGGGGSRRRVSKNKNKKKEEGSPLAEPLGRG